MQYLRQMLNRAEQTRTCKIVKGMLQRTLKITHFEKVCPNFVNKSTHFEKNFKCVDVVDMNAH